MKFKSSKSRVGTVRASSIVQSDSSCAIYVPKAKLKKTDTRSSSSEDSKPKAKLSNRKVSSGDEDVVKIDGMTILSREANESDAFVSVSNLLDENANKASKTLNSRPIPNDVIDTIVSWESLDTSPTTTKIGVVRNFDNDTNKVLVNIIPMSYKEFISTKPVIGSDTAKGRYCNQGGSCWISSTNLSLVYDKPR